MEKYNLFACCLMELFGNSFQLDPDTRTSGLM